MNINKVTVKPINGTDADEKLMGTPNNDSIYGWGGSDTLHGGTGNDLLDGGSDGKASHGIATLGDFADYKDAPKAVIVDLQVGIAIGGAGNDTLSNIENIWGSPFADYLMGNNADNKLSGYAGSDIIHSGEGTDSIYGGAGDDYLDGGSVNYSGYYDTVYYTDSPSEVEVNLQSGTATGGDGNDRLMNIKGVWGSDFNDSITGDNNNNMLAGAAGSDSIYGGSGDDILNGGAGDDYIDGGTSILWDSESKAPGNDIVDYSGSPNAIRVNLKSGTASGEGNDILVDIEGVWGSGNNDLLTGSADNNTLQGNAGNDTILGGSGDDSLIAGSGGDYLDGGSGNDVLGDSIDWGGTLIGGSGSDTFQFQVNYSQEITVTSVIKDFSHKQKDKIDLSLIDNYQYYETPPSLKSGGPFSDEFTTPGQYYFDKTAHVLYGNTDYDSAADIEINLTGVNRLLATDIIF